mmetsp:Transcript_20765/g.67751  ORF Transcript_20765/g.67751 Transcript_20765/m.67751 type:complete len:337 (-) Transcript_20765:173-1183(-)
MMSTRPTFSAVTRKSVWRRRPGCSALARAMYVMKALLLPATTVQPPDRTRIISAGSRTDTKQDRPAGTYVSPSKVPPAKDGSTQRGVLAAHDAETAAAAASSPEGVARSTPARGQPSARPETTESASRSSASASASAASPSAGEQRAGARSWQIPRERTNPPHEPPDCWHHSWHCLADGEAPAGRRRARSARATAGGHHPSSTPRARTDACATTAVRSLLAQLRRPPPYTNPAAWHGLPLAARATARRAASTAAESASSPVGNRTPSREPHARAPDEKPASPAGSSSGAGRGSSAPRAPIRRQRVSPRAACVQTSQPGVSWHSSRHASGLLTLRSP